jgi:hypothetical protein
MLLVSSLFVHVEETAHQVSLGGNIFMFKTLEDPPANEILMQCNMPLSSVCCGIFFNKFHFAGTIHWMKRKYIKQVLK